MRELVKHRHGGKIAGVARGSFKSANAAFAQHNAGIAVRGDVLRGHQQLLDGGAHAALQQHRPTAPAQFLE